MTIHKHQSFEHAVLGTIRTRLHRPVTDLAIAAISVALLITTLLTLTMAAKDRASSHAGAPQFNNLDLINAVSVPVTYRGKQALRLDPVPEMVKADTALLGIIPGSDFQDGTIEVDLAGAPRKDADPTARGFIGIAFHLVADDPLRGDLFYIRPVNARADDQLARNHAVQYMAYPDNGWRKLRTETPGLYESYTDMEPGAWTHIKIVVSGTKAKLYVNGAQQPALVVNGLKSGVQRGKLALWSYTSTEGYFSGLKVTPGQ
jgi:Concanavalin A-like lectin/glucanases superfamily